METLLVTSRDTGRWIIPQGWPIDGQSLAESAATEAWEEAGVRGKIGKRAIGRYQYLKRSDGHAPDLPCAVEVYALETRKLANSWPEADQRKRRWCALEDAAERVDEADLKQLLLGFAPSPS